MIFFLKTCFIWCPSSGVVIRGYMVAVVCAHMRVYACACASVYGSASLCCVYVLWHECFECMPGNPSSCVCCWACASHLCARVLESLSFTVSASGKCFIFIIIFLNYRGKKMALLKKTHLQNIPMTSYIKQCVSYGLFESLSLKKNIQIICII